MRHFQPMKKSTLDLNDHGNKIRGNLQQYSHITRPNSHF